MGRKVWWRRGLELLVLFTFHRAVLGDGDVGCLFSESLCDPQIETCYNDLAFGKCLPLYTDIDDDDLYRYDFNAGELDLLRQQLETLELDGYKWKHPYTQCIMQTSLYQIRHGKIYDLQLCEHLKEYERANQESRINQDIRVPAIAIVKFTPNNGNFQSDFANELYYPPSTQDRYVRRSSYDNGILQPTYTSPIEESVDQIYKTRYVPISYNEYASLTSDENSNDLSNDLSRKSFVIDDYDPLRKSFAINDYDPPRKSFAINDYDPLRKSFPINDYDPPRKSYATDDYDEKLYRYRRQPYNFENYEEDAIEAIRNALEKEKLSRKYLEDENLGRRQTLSEDDLEFLIDDAPPSNYPLISEDEADDDREYEKAFSRKYKHQRKFPNSEFLENGKSWLDSVKRNFKLKEKSVSYGNEESDSSDKEGDFFGKEDKIITEGGFVEATQDNSNENSNGNDYGSLLDDDDLDSSFKRRERLDVKKPGPLFSTNNYAFKTQPPPTGEKENQYEENQSNEVLLMPLVKKEVTNNGHHLKDLTKTYNNVDLDYVYMEVQKPFHTWSEGEHVVKEVAKQLGLIPGTLRDIRVGRAEVTFKVIQNNKNYNATDVVNSIDNIRGKLRDSLGIEVIRAGIGDKAKLPATLEVANDTEMSSSLFGAIVAAGITAAAAAAVVTLIIARRHAKSRAKLAGLATPDPEASKDYQDLCRARMQAKQPTEKPESPRITSLSRESDSNNTGSNRSSTSSWSDEAALSNLDTSTGHIVLSYMEDHLKNEDRLDQEWKALCAYEADPSAMENAEKEENLKKNRPDAPLPYDHSRVVLNYLANAEDSDYINASTIMDHDPRNPAYIATQGPLPHTAAEFWQMVWEQGSVVIVMLTRLTEDGVPMCHRYWPEQEFEQYNIYEVHLLSEYPGCDDYLVRSFYLKNLDTGETRTVTQFHFLSWPESRIPHSTKALLEFRRKVNKSYRGRSCPIIVHCSDGAGRTGTYCLIDMVLNRMMKGTKEIDIAATLEHIRDQRANMVATRQQFEFVFVAVAEEVRAILKALPVPPAEKLPAASGNNPPNQSSN